MPLYLKQEENYFTNHSKPHFMKTNSKYQLLILSLFTVLSLQAQVNIPYEIQNNTSCAVTLNWVVYDISGCAACDGGSNITIPAN